VILVDTNVWSELTKTPCHEAVVGWLEANDLDLWLSTIVFAELRMGIERLPRARRREWLEIWCEGLMLEFEDRMVTFDLHSAKAFAKLVVQRKMEKQENKLLDLQLAAQALAHDMTLATRNVKDFAWTGVKLVNPWDA
jgi:toxin FitB